MKKIRYFLTVTKSLIVLENHKGIIDKCDAKTVVFVNTEAVNYLEVKICRKKKLSQINVI